MSGASGSVEIRIHRGPHIPPRGTAARRCHCRPLVAATPAATLVAHDTLGAAGQRLLDDRMLNVVLVLVLATAILGPMLTEHFASRLIIGARRWHRLDRARRRVLAGAAGGRLVDLCRGRRLVSRLCRLRSRLDWHPPLARCGPAPFLNGTLSGGIHKKVPRLKFLDNKPAVRPCP